MKTIKSLLLILTMAFCMPFAKAQSTTNNIDKITTAYLGIKNALVAGESTTAKVKAEELYSLLAAQPDKGLSGSQKKFVSANLEMLLFDSRHISETDKIDHQREHFASLSKNMYAFLKGVKLNTISLYEQYCPMKKSTWLSETAKIKNPYYGDKMIECGQTKEKLAAAK
ncbi:DUF3347 domain-containing protein [Mucilaginibacter sp.]|uniref:DUF3347 domain-containing protein n=1 Tax=Mucilaginibacter sp. TaxID=1882438 RepID=UPI003D1305F5